MPTLHYQIVPPGEVREDGGIIFFPRVEELQLPYFFSPCAFTPRRMPDVDMTASPMGGIAYYETDTR